MIGLTNKEGLLYSNNETPPMGLKGDLLQPVALADLTGFIGKILSLKQVCYVGKPERIIKTVGLCAGNGTSHLLIKAALGKNCDVYITGDINYHFSMGTQESGMALIDGTHYATENFIADAIANRIHKKAEEEGIDIFVKKADYDGQVFKFT